MPLACSRYGFRHLIKLSLPHPLTRSLFDLVRNTSATFCLNYRRHKVSYCCNIPIIIGRTFSQVVSVCFIVGAIPTPRALLCKIYYSHIIRYISVVHKGVALSSLFIFIVTIGDTVFYR